MSPEEYASADGFELIERVRRNEVTPQELSEAAQKKYEEVNLRLNAVIFTDFEAMRENIPRASAGPMKGLPFLIKGLGTAVQGFPRHYCSKLFKGAVADHDSDLIKRYKAGGLNIFGLTNSPEFGLNVTTEPELTGATLNPVNPEYSAGGSSGGAAAAVKAGIVPIAHASDGGGSIRIPASCCGLFGLKPSRGRIPAGPQTGEQWAGMATEHVLSKSVRDSAMILDLTCEPDFGAPYRIPSPEKPYLLSMKDCPEKPKIAYCLQTFQGKEVSSDSVCAVLNTVEALKDIGYQPIEDSFSYEAESLIQSVHTVIVSNIHWNLDRAKEKLHREILPEDLEPVTFALYQNISRFSATDYLSAVDRLHAVSRKIARFFLQYDVLITPTLATPPKKLGVLSTQTENFDEYAQKLFAYNPFTSIFNVTGQPAASLPLHQTAEGLPVGVQMITASTNETLLFQLAAVLEPGFL